MMQTHSAPPIPAAAVPAFAPDQWLYQLFSPIAVAEGRTLRCPVVEADAHLGRTRLIDEARLRGYRVTQSKGELVLTLDRAPIRVPV